MSIKAKGNKSKIKRELLAKPKKDFSKKVEYDEWLLLTNYRNHLYNETDKIRSDHPEFTPLKLTFMIWCYGHDFFSYKGALKNFRGGFEFIREGIPYLKRIGFLDIYSPKQLIEIDVQKDGYVSVEEGYLKERLHLTLKGKRIVEQFFNTIHKVRADDYEIRNDRIKP